MSQSVEGFYIEDDRLYTRGLENTHIGNYDSFNVMIRCTNESVLYTEKSFTIVWVDIKPRKRVIPTVFQTPRDRSIISRPGSNETIHDSSDFSNKGNIQGRGI